MKIRFLFFLINLLICFGGFFFLVHSGFRFDPEIFAYGLDDSYIHLSIAKNFAFEGIWGVTSYEYSSSSSSPLYTLILSSLIAIIGNYSILPLIANSIFLLLFIFYLNFYSSLANAGFMGGLTTLYVAICSLIFHLTAMGMEHALQLLIILVLLDRMNGKFLYFESLPTSDYLFLFLILVATSVRFENIFIIASLCFLLLFQRRFREILILSFVAFLPLVTYGIFSIYNGAGFLPNSLVMKSHQGSNFTHTIYLHASSFVKNLFLDNSLVIVLLIPLVIQSILLFKKNGKNIRNAIKSVELRLSVIVIVTCILHNLFAKVDWLHRYENYLLLLLVFALQPTFNFVHRLLRKDTVELRKKVLTIISLFLIGSPFVGRFITTLGTHYRAQSDIYYQHIQTAKFILSNPAMFDREVIGINDIGAVSYYTDSRILDVFGLATRKIAEQQYVAPDEYMPRLIDSLNVHYAIVYKSQFPDHFSGWHHVGWWDMGEHEIVVSPKLDFLARDIVASKNMLDALKRYENSLPSAVQTLYPTTKQ